ncbi:tail fiber domain-containing protein [Halapricum salinum]|uniref:Peptidase S74 domain-containing protein n=1 Tax=Halapricum salinum TaxID=1457250 RepID=A0A4D6HCM0_9EURY|nr:tail fiber domain-containing protein [Halapricum salinum]QCC51743.1 hypothetical protein DV733_11065 [Halapricum salinum]
MTDSEDQTDIDDEQLDSTPPSQAMAASSYKILGEFSDSSGAGVLGKNTASNGTPIGVQGAVPNASGGFGLDTPDDARVGGAIETPTGHNLTVDGSTVFRTEALGTDGNGNTTGGSIVGGMPLNSANGAVGAVIGGGGASGDEDLGGSIGVRTNNNQVLYDFGTISGGFNNRAYSEAVVAGGSRNTASNTRATVSGGWRNVASASGSTIGGGGSNTAAGTDATVAGGTLNEAYTGFDSIGGGSYNQVGWPSTTPNLYGTVGGGWLNHVEGKYGTIAGGAPSDTTDWTSQNDTNNTVYDDYGSIGGGGGNQAGTSTSGTEDGIFATVPGGRDNTASGAYSFAAGRQAQAEHDGAFVWADSTSGSVTSTASNQFLIEAGGGVGVNTTSPDAPLDVGGGNNFDLQATEGDFKIGDDTHRFKIGVATGGGGAGIATMRAQSSNINKLNLGAGTSDVVSIETDSVSSVYPASDNTYSLGKSGNRWSAIYAADGTIQTSDARLKTNVSDLDSGIETVQALRPVSYEWDEETDEAQAEADTRLGLIAQEVADVVPEAVVEPEDADGPLGLAYDMLIPVLLDAVDEQQETIDDLQTESEHLRERNANLEGRLDAVEAHLGLSGTDGTATPADD